MDTLLRCSKDPSHYYSAHLTACDICAQAVAQAASSTSQQTAPPSQTVYVPTGNPGAPFQPTSPPTQTTHLGAGTYTQPQNTTVPSNQNATYQNTGRLAPTPVRPIPPPQPWWKKAAIPVGVLALILAGAYMLKPQASADLGQTSTRTGTGGGGGVAADAKIALRKAADEALLKGDYAAYTKLLHPSFTGYTASSEQIAQKQEWIEYLQSLKGHPAKYLAFSSSGNRAILANGGIYVTSSETSFSPGSEGQILIASERVGPPCDAMKSADCLREMPVGARATLVKLTVESTDKSMQSAANSLGSYNRKRISGVSDSYLRSRALESARQGLSDVENALNRAKSWSISLTNDQRAILANNRALAKAILGRSFGSDLKDLRSKSALVLDVKRKNILKSNIELLEAALKGRKVIWL